MDPATKALSSDTIHLFLYSFFMIYFENLLLYTTLLNLEHNVHEYVVIFLHVISVTWKDALACLSEEMSSHSFSESNGGTFILLLGFVYDSLCTMVSHLYQSSIQQFS